MIKQWLHDLFTQKESVEIKEWRNSNSILKFLSSNLDKNGFLSENAHTLPDEIIDEGKLKFAPGLKDALFGADDSDESKKRIAVLLKHLKRIALKGDKISEQEFFRLVSEDERVIGIIDNFLQAMVNESLPIDPYLFKYAKDLATMTSNRNSVKFGIAILGYCKNKTVLNDIKTLALHDEFTVFGAIAIANLSDNAEMDLWEIAKKVDGWGKIQLVDRLSQPDVSEAIKEWLIYEGYKNSIMYEYLAYTCAINGELHKRIENNEINHKLFISTSEIIDALLSIGGPAEDITTYPFASQLIQDFLRHAKIQSIDIAVFNTLHNIKDYLTELQLDIGSQKSNGWNQDIISNCLIELFLILNSRDWKVLVFEDLKSNENAIYWNAKSAAEKLGIDLWETFWSKLNEKPLDSTAWYDVTHYNKSDYSDEIIDFALKKLPLDEMASGPKDSVGHGENYHKYSCLDYVIMFLKGYPKKGEKIILTGLKSPVTRNRNITISVLDKWKKGNWSKEIEGEVRHLGEIEPNKVTKENIKRLLNGEDLK